MFLLPVHPVLDDPDDVVVDLPDLRVLPDGGLDVLQHLHLGGSAHEAGHLAVPQPADPAHPAHAVDVVRRVQGEVVVDNMAVNCGKDRCLIEQFKSLLPDIVSVNAPGN